MRHACALIVVGVVGCGHSRGGSPPFFGPDAGADGGGTTHGGDAAAPDASSFSCASDVALEPNDDLAHAVVTAIPSFPEDEFTIGVICPSTDQDVYAFGVTSATQHVHIALTYDAAAGELALDLLDAQGTKHLYTPTRTGNSTVYEIPGLVVGTWYVRVYGAPGVTNSYDLDLRVGE